MADTPNWHDAHALMLIDCALEDGGFTQDRVVQITEALRAAAEAPRGAAAADHEHAAA
jgi:hypothetical protein